MSLSAPSADVSENLRYLLLESGTPREQWVETLAGWAQVTPERARRLMEREPPNQRLTGEELKRIAAETHREEEMIRHQRLATADEPGLVRRNFEYLMESLGHGEKQKLAAHLGVDLSNLSKWSRGDYGIREKHLDKIAAYFHLPSGQSLAQEPLFLSLVPSGASAQKNWLKSRIDATDPATLQKLFPALERLLKP